MKKILFLIVLSISTTYAQENNPSETELEKHDLKWINFQNFFEQEKLSKIQIENELKSIVQKQVDKKILVSDMTLPFNEKKLNYLGYINPNELEIFSKNPITNSYSSEIFKKLHVYKYDDFYVSVENDSMVDQLNVYHTIRAINILKYRYTLAFEKLFLNTKSYLSENPKFGYNYVNKNVAFWIGFNKNPSAIASNNTHFVQDGYIDNENTITKYSNISIVNIDSENILGKGSVGSKPIYNEDSPEKNHLRYLKEGLVESIVHEMLHNYIDFSHMVKEDFYSIKKMRGKPKFNNFEECIILNTSLTYFYNKSGFSNSLKEFYYPNTFQFNIDDLKSENLFVDYYKKVFGKEPIEILTNLKVDILEE